MIVNNRPSELKLIPIDRIDVLNPRERNSRIFEEVVENIKTIGLKKPITVTSRKGADGTERYLLVCGEGRLKAFKALNETKIPAQVIDVTDDDAFIMSLAENIARVKRRPLEILASIDQLRENGYNSKEIAEKTGLHHTYVHGILTLLQRGEERLLLAVEKGRIPLTAAITIAGAGDDDKAVQVALQEAYESGKLRGKCLHQAKRIIESRKSLGRSLSRDSSSSNSGARVRTDISTSTLVRTYQKEVERQKLLVRKAEFTQQRLFFIVGALRKLLSDENFAVLLRAEALDTLPKYLAEKVWASRSQA